MIGSLQPVRLQAKGQDVPTNLPPFTVATIKQVEAADRDAMSIRFSEDGVLFRSVWIAWIVQEAFFPQQSIYSESDRIVGLPSWTKSAHFDVQAKVDDDDVSKWKALSISQKRLALQRLLITRFDLQFHHETRERPVYSLVVGKNGPKLNRALADSTGGGDRSLVAAGKIVLHAATLSVLANSLSSQGLGHSVVDKTGLPDLYDITLQWSPDNVDSSDASLPPLFTALQEQLGLKLEYSRNPVDVLVIDRIEKPSEN
jgi:bla regulator protein BlaR1